MKKTDVAIIGGGIIGSAIAYYLSKRDVKVTVLERGKLLGGASGANQGGIPVSVFDPPLLDLVLASRELYGKLPEELGDDLGLDQTGLLLLVLDQEQIPLLLEFKKKLSKRGMVAERLSEQELREEALVADAVVGAVRTDIDASVDPFRVGFGFIRRARGNGAVFLKDTEVTDMKTKGDLITQVRTTRESIKPDHVVNAAGPDARFIGEMVGIDLPVKPRRGQVLVTEPAPRSNYRYLMDFDYIATALEVKSDEEIDSERMSLGVASSLIQEPSCNWTIGASRDFAGFNKNTTPRTLGHLADRAAKFISGFEETKVIRSYAGLRPYCSVDGMPIIGRVSTLSNFSVATGHAGEGITLAPITGKLVAQEIVEERKPSLLDGFRYSRFIDD